MGLRHSFSRRAAFITALISTPALVAAVGGVLAWIGDAADLGGASVVGVFLLFSVAFGGPSYLLVGSFFFWRTARGERRGLGAYALAGLLANLVAGILSIPVVAIVNTAVDIAPEHEGAVVIALVVHAFGLLFAPIYGLLFGWCFNYLAGDLDPPSKLTDEVEAVFR